jgi:hypothetical protein
MLQRIFLQNVLLNCCTSLNMWLVISNWNETERMRIRVLRTSEGNENKILRRINGSAWARVWFEEARGNRRASRGVSWGIGILILIFNRTPQAHLPCHSWVTGSAESSAQYRIPESAILTFAVSSAASHAQRETRTLEEPECKGEKCRKERTKS